MQEAEVKNNNQKVWNASNQKSTTAAHSGQQELLHVFFITALKSEESKFPTCCIQKDATGLQLFNRLRGALQVTAVYGCHGNMSDEWRTTSL